MRLLVDENVSWRLAAYFRPQCEAVLHMRAIGLDESPDTSIWRCARQHGYNLLTKGEAFARPVLVETFPPRLVALQNAQVPVKALAKFLLARLLQPEPFPGKHTEFGMLQLRLP